MAVKKIDWAKVGDQKKQIEQVLNEGKILELPKSNFLMTSKYAFTTEKRLYYVMPFIYGFPLNEFLYRQV